MPLLFKHWDGRAGEAEPSVGWVCVRAGLRKKKKRHGIDDTSTAGRAHRPGGMPANGKLSLSSRLSELTRDDAGDRRKWVEIILVIFKCNITVDDDVGFFLHRTMHDALEIYR